MERVFVVFMLVASVCLIGITSAIIKSAFGAVLTYPPIEYPNPPPGKNWYMRERQHDGPYHIFSEAVGGCLPSDYIVYATSGYYCVAMGAASHEDSGDSGTINGMIARHLECQIWGGQVPGMQHIDCTEWVPKR